jgi:hypothetical protein
MPEVSKEAKLWSNLYALLCRWAAIQGALANMPEHEQPTLDDRAEAIIKQWVSESNGGH